MSAIPSAVLARVRPMTSADVAAVLRIERRAYDFPWSAGIFRDCLRVGYRCRVLTIGRQVIGYSILSVAAGEAHLLNLCVDPAFQREGHGQRLLEYVLESAREGGALWLYLEVRPSNAAALALYGAAGFSTVGRRRRYYEARDGREDAVVLAKEL